MLNYQFRIIEQFVIQDGDYYLIVYKCRQNDNIYKMGIYVFTMIRIIIVLCPYSSPPKLVIIYEELVFVTKNILPHSFNSAREIIPYIRSYRQNIRIDIFSTAFHKLLSFAGLKHESLFLFQYYILRFAHWKLYLDVVRFIGKVNISEAPPRYNVQCKKVFMQRRLKAK